MKFRLFIIWLSIIGVLVFSMVPHLLPDYWIADNLAHFKVQFIVISLLLLIAVIFLLRQKAPAMILLLLIICWNAYFIFPLYMGPSVEIKNEDLKLKITGINLLSGNTGFGEVQNYISRQDPDLLVLMEFTENWKTKLEPFLDRYEYQTLVPREDNFGIAILSKIEINTAIEYFGLNNKPSLVGQFMLEDKPVTIIATHPVPPVGQWMFEHRNKQLANIMTYRPRYSENLIIIGDLNTSSFSAHFKQLLKGGLKDTRKGFGQLPTWPAGLKILQTTLDHCLVSENFSVIDRNTGENIGSDHLPINVELILN
ncbi:endonuclease/exonuclease/phosphatase family protein [Antarcticibacterium arcticum]|uniref:Endonuclease/exonuclease/phosphatase family protein n=1 Tax=Antarcticibacterium arcticum TaxID=2585771 RepID=A0A5B8YIZ2_9FLAO|nr:endonuclease/exonuclease/phosphatase family protein [Antarcticibacterium arcticum]QED36807.1 endonuclease/exonuclease/phosphatase family protein [Antarcticibacterium arcticum]